jgi:predicted Zn-dependent peptidase
VVGFKGLRRADPSTWIMKLIHVILGANMSSRLFEKVREEQALAYDISTSYRSYHDSGCFSVHTGLAGENVVKTLDIVFKELRLLQKTLVKKDEFQRAQDYLLGQHIMAFERNMDMMLYMGENLLGLGYVPVLKEIKDRIRSVTPAQVRNMAQYIFGEDMIKVSLVGKVDDTISAGVKQFLKRLQ